MICEKRNLTETEIQEKYNLYILKFICMGMDDLIHCKVFSYEEFKERRLNNEQ